MSCHTLVNSTHDYVTHLAEMLTHSWTGEEIRNHIIGWQVRNLERPIIDKLFDPEVPQLDVLRLRSGRSSSHMSHTNCARVVLVDHCGLLREM